MGQFMKSVPSPVSACVCSAGPPFMSKTLHRPWLKLQGMLPVHCQQWSVEWIGVGCVALGRVHVSFRRPCIRLEKQREATLCPWKLVNQKAGWGPALRTWGTAECKTERTWEHHVLYFTYEKTEAWRCQEICPHFFPIINFFIYSAMISECFPCVWLCSRCWGFKENKCCTGSRNLSQVNLKESPIENEVSQGRKRENK